MPCSGNGVIFNDQKFPESDPSGWEMVISTLFFHGDLESSNFFGENSIRIDDLGGPPLFLETPMYKWMFQVLDCF